MEKWSRWQAADLAGPIYGQVMAVACRQSRLAPTSGRQLGERAALPRRHPHAVAPFRVAMGLPDLTSFGPLSAGKAAGR